MTDFKTYGNVALCQRVAMILETKKLDGNIRPFEFKELQAAGAELNRRMSIAISQYILVETTKDAAP